MGSDRISIRMIPTYRKNIRIHSMSISSMNRKYYYMRAHPVSHHHMTYIWSYNEHPLCLQRSHKEYGEL